MVNTFICIQLMPTVWSRYDMVQLAVHTWLCECIGIFQEYGSLLAAPLEIKARIVEMEQMSMNNVRVVLF